MTAPCNISHILSDVDVYCDNFASKVSPEMLERVTRVGKSTMARIFTSMVSIYGANISGYSVRDQKTFGKVDMDKDATCSSQDIVRFIEQVYEQRKDVILHAVISSINAYLLSLAGTEERGETIYTLTYKNGEITEEKTTISPKVKSVNQDFVDALLNPKNKPVHLVSISGDRYITPDGRVVRFVEDAGLWGGDQGSLFDDAPVVTPSAADVTQKFTASMVEKHGDTYGPATVKAISDDIAAGHAAVNIHHNPIEEGGFQYTINGRIK